MNKNLSVFVCGTPVNDAGFRLKAFGFLSKLENNFYKYFDFEREYMPNKIGQEHFRLVKLIIDNQVITLFTSYRYINPNDQKTNRNNYIACGLAIKGAVNLDSATLLFASVIELHGYLVRYIDFKHYCLKPQIGIEQLNFPDHIRYQQIKIKEAHTPKKDHKKKYYSHLIEQHHLPSIISNFSEGIAINETADIILLQDEIKFLGRAFLKLDQLSSEGILQNYDKLLDQKSKEIASKEEEIKKYESRLKSIKKLDELTKEINRKNNRIKELEAEAQRHHKTIQKYKDFLTNRHIHPEAPLANSYPIQQQCLTKYDQSRPDMTTQSNINNLRYYQKNSNSYAERSSNGKSDQRQPLSRRYPTEYNSTEYPENKYNKRELFDPNVLIFFGVIVFGIFIIIILLILGGIFS